MGSEIGVFHHTSLSYFLSLGSSMNLFLPEYLRKRKEERKEKMLWEMGKRKRVIRLSGYHPKYL